MTYPPDDPAEHARDFGRRHADRFEHHTRERMKQLGIPEHRIGTPVGGTVKAFDPDQCDGGGVIAGDGINVDSGILNPDLLQGIASPETAEAWGKARLRDRMDTVIPHEDAESATGRHDDAVNQAPDTPLPIRDGARELLRKIRSDSGGQSR